MSLEDQGDWSRTYTAEDMIEMVEEGRLPMLIQTDTFIGLYVVDPAPNSKLKSENEDERLARTSACMVVAGNLLNSEGAE